MGRGSQRRRQFFTEHPRCCFCGGNTLATEEDHFPARAHFRQRQWPEGFVFPACSACNRATSRDELLVAFLARIGIREESATPQDVKEHWDLMQGVAREFPGLLASMYHGASHRQRRETRKVYSKEIPDGTPLDQVRVLSGADPQIHSAMQNVGRKLGLALYYRIFRESMPMTGGVAVRWLTNVQVDKGAIPDEFASLLTESSMVARAGDDLSEQFFCRSRAAEHDDLKAANFLAAFHHSFVFLGMTSNQRGSLKSFEDGDTGDVFTPYQ
jgi:hypothetical protein